MPLTNSLWRERMLFLDRSVLCGNWKVCAGNYAHILSRVMSTVGCCDNSRWAFEGSCRLVPMYFSIYTQKVDFFFGFLVLCWGFVACLLWLGVLEEKCLWQRQNSQISGNAGNNVCVNCLWQFELHCVANTCGAQNLVATFLCIRFLCGTHVAKSFKWLLLIFPHAFLMPSAFHLNKENRFVFSLNGVLNQYRDKCHSWTNRSAKNMGVLLLRVKSSWSGDPLLTSHRPQHKRIKSELFFVCGFYTDEIDLICCADFESDMFAKNICPGFAGFLFLQPLGDHREQLKVCNSLRIQTWNSCLSKKDTSCRERKKRDNDSVDTSSCRTFLLSCNIVFLLRYVGSGACSYGVDLVS